MESSSEHSTLVSIVTPARNAEAFLPETIQSVQGQTYSDWEWLIVDDGSTDKTVELIQAAAASDPRIRFETSGECTGSAARARNLGLAKAKGDLIAFLDADDQWMPEKLSRQVDYLVAHSDAMGVCSWFKVFGDEQRMSRESRLMPRSPVCRRDEILSGSPFQTSTFMFRRRIYDEMGGMDEDPRLKSGQDSEYFIRIVCRYPIHRILMPLTRYRLAEADRSLSASQGSAENVRGWNIFQILVEKQILDSEEQRRWRSFLYYEQARDNLFMHDAPFRFALWRCVLAGRPPLRAVTILLLSFLPARLLRPSLLFLQDRLGQRLGNSSKVQAE